MRAIVYTLCRKNRLYILLIYILITAGGSVSYTQTQSSSKVKFVNLSGYLTDGFGNPISVGVLSLVTKDEDSVVDGTLDQAGHFAIAAHPGDYTLYVSVSGFERFSEPIHLGDTSTATKNIALKLSKLVECGPCLGPSGPPSKVDLLSTSLTSTLPLHPLPPLKFRRHIPIK